jgi:small subunit ribosomal protein S1
MLHVSELGFGRVGRPHEALTVGQQSTVQILKIERTQDPKRPERISLSLKSLAHDPWEDVGGRFFEGARVTGTVVRVEAYGAFVELTPGIEGLVHLSELGGQRPLRHARQALKPGETVAVSILGVDLARRRISLGLAGAEDEPATDETRDASTPNPGFGTFADLLRSRPIK